MLANSAEADILHTQELLADQTERTHCVLAGQRVGCRRSSNWCILINLQMHTKNKGSRANLRVVKTAKRIAAEKRVGGGSGSRTASK